VYAKTAAAGDWQSVLAFWFGPHTGDPEADRRWFSKDPAFDLELRERFGGVHAAVTAGECESWLSEPSPTLAYVLVCDQLSRNLFRGTPRAFAADRLALAAARMTVGLRWDERMRPLERLFVYFPYQHSENLLCQHASLALFGGVRALPEASSFYRYAERHFDVIARFGRFPHRNKVLGRASTPAEVVFLQQSGSGF
jgi:uncharacterized protein (DUF924 family)